MDFRSDNVTGMAPPVLAALAAANPGTALGYGADDVTRRVEVMLGELFEREVAVFPVGTGTAANSLALSVMVPPYGAIFCHELAHINVDECAAPELFTGGAKLIDLPGAHGKLDAALILDEIAKGAQGNVHNAQPAAVSLTQATERGTVYRPAEIAEIAEVAHRHDLKVHMDGARFANAIASLGCPPAETSWRAGVDLLSLGGTKNGAMAAEAVVFFDRALAAHFGFRRKRGGHLFSKMRFVSAQLEALFKGGLWLEHAAHANRLARRLADGVRLVPGAEILDPVEANLFYVRMPEPVLAGLEADGFKFYREGGPETIRLVTAFDTEPAHVDAFIASTAKHAAALPAGAARYAAASPSALRAQTVE
jgi:threonine aldolase